MLLVRRFRPMSPSGGERGGKTEGIPEQMTLSCWHLKSYRLRHCSLHLGACRPIPFRTATKLWLAGDGTMCWW